MLDVEIRKVGTKQFEYNRCRHGDGHQLLLILRSIVGAGLVCASLGLSTMAAAGVVDPECTAKKAGKSAAMKATVGVGGRCDMAEAATDTAKRTVDAEGKSTHGDEAGVVKKSAKATKNLVTD